jgi:hypothetical protein
MNVESELALLRADFPVAARYMPLAHLAAWLGASDDAIELAVDLAVDQSYVEAALVPEISLPSEIGALAQWRVEVSRGFRNVSDIDALSHAAICESNARDELRYGLRAAARQSRLDAAKFIASAVESRQAQAA